MNRSDIKSQAEYIRSRKAKLAHKQELEKIQNKDLEQYLTKIEKKRPLFFK